MDVTPIASTVGARIDGVDLRGSLDADEVAALRRAVLEHGVVFLPAQGLDDDRQVALRRRVRGAAPASRRGVPRRRLPHGERRHRRLQARRRLALPHRLHLRSPRPRFRHPARRRRADAWRRHHVGEHHGRVRRAVAVAAVVPRGARRVPQSGVGVQRHRGATFRRGRGSPDPRALRRHDPPGGHRAPGDGPQRALREPGLHAVDRRPPRRRERHAPRVPVRPRAAVPASCAGTGGRSATSRSGTSARRCTWAKGRTGRRNGSCVA